MNIVLNLTGNMKQKKGKRERKRHKNNENVSAPFPSGIPQKLIK